jgi:hypothetical protein
MKQVRLLVALFAVVTLTAGCSDANEQFIQGSWYYKDPHLESVPGETRQEVVWTFDRGTFELYACCFSGEIHQTGRYSIVESEGDVLTLELFNVRGQANAAMGQIRLVINRDEDTLSIQGSGPFERTLSPFKSS